jgi:hypothetical protein
MSGSPYRTGDRAGSATKKEDPCDGQAYEEPDAEALVQTLRDYDTGESQP